MKVPLETFPALRAIAFVRHAFTLRVPGLDVKTDRHTALARLEQFHEEARRELIRGESRFVTAEQVHGCEVAVVDAKTSGCAASADGLITNVQNVCLGIYVADCCAVFLVDPVQRAIGLLHSGRKGTELRIVAAALAAMRSAFGTAPENVIVQLSPCIRPPLYEVDIAAMIAGQCRDFGVREIFDCGENTGADTVRYYSYRVERGQTGRMLALLAL